MFTSSQAKLVSTQLRQHESVLSPAVADAFENAVVGCGGEVRFFDQLIVELANVLSSISIPGVTFGARVGRIHQKPIVKHSGGSCELGDLLVVIKYHLVDGSVEQKSIVYQVKMADSGSSGCSIAPVQLSLLRDWPSFSFGRDAAGAPLTYTVHPHTLEFGSYMLEPRLPVRQSVRPPAPYGSSPNAHCVAARSGGKAPVHRLSYTAGDAEVFLSHLVFESGEHHSNQPVADLVAAVYRFVGLAPDPPGEFDGFARNPDDPPASDGDDEDDEHTGSGEDHPAELHARDGDDLFAILEVNVSEGEELASLFQNRTRPPDTTSPPAVLPTQECTIFTATHRWATEREVAKAEARREREEESTWGKPVSTYRAFEVDTEPTRLRQRLEGY